MTEPGFDKYRGKGAYHWSEMKPDLFRRNAVLSARYRIALRHLPPPSRRILDLGCGDGYLSSRMAALGHSVVGCDTSDEGLSLARQMADAVPADHRPTFLRTDPYDTGLPDGSFDVVVLADVIEHVTDPGRLVREVHRVLQPGGLLLASTPCAVRGHVWDSRHVREYTTDEIGRILTPPFSKARCREYQLHFLYRLYVFRLFGLAPFRVVVNALDLGGINPFCLPRKILPLCAAGQIHVIAHR